MSITKIFDWPSLKAYSQGQTELSLTHKVSSRSADNLGAAAIGLWGDWKATRSFSRVHNILFETLAVLAYDLEVARL